MNQHFLVIYQARWLNVDGSLGDDLKWASMKSGYFRKRQELLHFHQSWFLITQRHRTAILIYIGTNWHLVSFLVYFLLVAAFRLGGWLENIGTQELQAPFNHPYYNSGVAKLCSLRVFTECVMHLSIFHGLGGGGEA